MKTDLLDVIFAAIGAVLGRISLFVAALVFGAFAGAALGYARISIVEAAFAFLPPLASSGLILFAAIVLLVVYLRFEGPQWLLALASVAFAFEGYWIGLFIRSLS